MFGGGRPQAERDEAGLTDFRYPSIQFPPSYKCVVGERGFVYQPSCVPSFTDRILYRDAQDQDPTPTVNCTQYDVIGNVASSEHKPVRAAFEI